MKCGVEALPGGIGCIGGQHARLRFHDVGERGVGDVLAERWAPPAAPTHWVVEQPRMLVELTDESALADAGWAEHGHQAGLTLADHMPQRGCEQRQLVVPANQRQIARVVVELRWYRCQGEPDLGRCRPSAQGQLRLGGEADFRTGGRVRGAADQHPTCRGLGLQARGRVDHVAGHDRLSAVVCRSDIDKCLSGGDANPERPTRLLVLVFARAGPGSTGRASARCRSSPARTARTASASVATGAPKSTIAASPMNFSTTPPYWRTTRRTAAKKSL